MDMFKMTGPHSYGGGAEVDLDDLKTYPERFFEMSHADLHREIWTEMGRSLYYMDFFHPDFDWKDQRERVYDLCREYAEGRKELYSNKPQDRLWCYKILYRFIDEVENQCQDSSVGRATA